MRDAVPGDDEGENAATPPSLTRDTLVDKGVRFGCGAVLAGLIVIASAISGLGEPVGVAGVIIAGLVFVLVCGWLSVTQGERFVRGLIKLMNWL
jgi:hypothetical protein